MAKKYQTRQERQELKGKHNKKKRVIIGLLSFILLVFAGIKIYINTQLNTVTFDKNEDLGITKVENNQKDDSDDLMYDELKEEIVNTLIIGVDEDDYSDARSDVMMIASVDTIDKQLKLTSLMRDTLVHLPTSNTYQKLNHSYMEGGPLETLRTVNSNLDLAIDNFIIFNFHAVEQAVDFIGGYPTYIDAGEAYDMKKEVGHHHLSGKDAVWYVRIRKNSGGDQGRNQRQRDLIVYILDQAKEMNKKDLVRFTHRMLPLIRTSYSSKDINQLINMYLAIKDNLDVEQYSFPSSYHGGKLNDGLWYATPTTMKDNVIQLQKDIFGTDNYIPSHVVDEISQGISSRSGLY